IQPDCLIWCEGEADKLALEVAGFKSVVSVPNGAPPVNSKNYSSLFSFLDTDKEKIGAVQKHIIAVDADEPGRKLEGELIRRLGPARCWRVQWPEGVKDANDLLMREGVEDLRWYIENATPMPIEGV